jgi:hypothetical protein
MKGDLDSVGYRAGKGVRTVALGDSRGLPLNLFTKMCRSQLEKEDFT